MRSHVKLGRIFGIEIGLHYSWILIALMIAVSLADLFGSTHPDWGVPVVWASALLTALLFFVALVAHELSHSLVAKSQGLPVRSITLFALGGVAQIEGEPANAKAEFRMAIAGPIASAAIGAVCLGLAWLFGWRAASSTESPATAVLEWLGYINLSLAVFNMIPGFPLDGGRVLRSIIWHFNGNAPRSTRIAARVGRAVAVLFMAAGVVRFAAGAGFGGLWIAFIGWFLFDAAGSSYAAARLSELLGGVRVSDLMVRDCPAVEAWTNLQSFVEDNALQTARFCFLVTSNGEMIGLISPREVGRFPQAQWRFKTVADVMRPLDGSQTISPDAPISEALETMGREDVNQLPVSEGGRISGVISRASVVGFLEARARRA
ncbi:MAG: M50 family metallopeptidase [Acidobacteriota bacterium]